MLWAVTDRSTEAPPAEIEVGRDAPVERLHLDDTSWVDVSRGWLAGEHRTMSTTR